MAIEHLASVTPHPATSDLVSLRACSELLKKTRRPASITTLRAWIEKYGIKTVRRNRGKVYVSYSDILEAHRKEYTGRN